MAGPKSDSGHPEGYRGCYPQKPQAAVGAVVFHKARVLLVRRGKPPAEGLWAIPGGSIELGETLQQAAEREILEETGVTIRAGAPILTFDVIERDDRDRVRFHYLIVDLAAEYVAGVPRAGDDARQARWVSAEEVEKLPLNKTTRNLLNDQYGFGRK